MKRPALLIGAAALVMAAGAAAAWLTQPPETAPPPRLSKAAKARLAAAQAVPSTAPAADIALPEALPPPPPTSTDFARTTDPLPPTEDKEASPIDWAAMPIDDLRRHANANDVTAMEELARRLVHGVGVAKDQQAGAGWLLRAAQRGSAQSAFNVAVMYERGFVVERDSTKAIEWYRKAIEANLPMAKHNLALLLRDGRGAPRNGKEAVELLRSAARQGMAASMFTLGDIHERGDAGSKDPAIALAWFAITSEFERQTNRGSETALGKMASQRVQVLQRVLLPGELERAQQFGQAEFKRIVEALQPPKPPAAPPPAETAAAAPSPPPTVAAEPEANVPGWPKGAPEQVRAVQQGLLDLKFLRDKPDGVLGPMTRNAIRAFQRSIGARETGEPTRDVFAALQEAIDRRDAAAKVEVEKAEATKAEAAKAEAAKAEAAKAAAGKAEAAKREAAKAAAAKAEAEKAEAAQREAAKAEAAKAEAAKREAAKAAAAKAEAEKAEAARREAAKVESEKVEAARLEAEKVATAKAEAERAEAARREEAKAEAVKAAAAKAEAGKADAARIETAKDDAAKAARRVDPPKPPMPPIDATPPPMPAIVTEPTKAETAKPAVATVNLAAPDAPAPPTSADLARALPKNDTGAWPTSGADQVRAIQTLLRELNFSQEAPDGRLGPATRTAIRDYERSLGLTQTGEPNKALFDSLKEMRALMKKSD